METELELTVIMPCLNESETLAICINKAKDCMRINQIDGEVLIADNGSTDGSIEIAKNLGARVIHVKEKGYGAALQGGIKDAKGKYCIMADADDSYDFNSLMPYINKLRAGYDLVMGNRFKGSIEKGAMPFLHKYLGTPVISFLGRLFYKNKIGDFNCGMRGFNTLKIRQLDLISPGMEFASEMIVKAALCKYKIAEVPTTLSVDGRSRKPHLNTWSDGWRHLKFLLIHSPNWLFLYPGMFFTVIGVIFFILIGLGPLKIGQVTFDVNTMLFSAAAVIIGVYMILFSFYTKIFAAQTYYIPYDNSIEKMKNFTAEKGIVIGVILFIVGLIAAILSFVFWGNSGFGNLNPEDIMRITIPATTFMIVGVELIFGGFFIAILQNKKQ